MRPLIIATRESPLALWQAHHVAGLIRARHGRETTVLKLTTEGDRFLQAPLAQIGGKGLFVKEIEQALLDRRADIAVHSLKDMTSAMPEGLLLACVPEREDPRDAFIGRKADRISELRTGARVGTSSLRRACQLRARRPDLEIVPLRGNVQTRLRRAEEQDLDGAVLAFAGLKRLGLAEVATEVISPEESLPAVGQGALAVQCRTDDAEVRGLLAALNHLPTEIAVTAERAYLALLQGGCTVPLAGFAERADGRLRLRGLVGATDGSRVLRDEIVGADGDAAQLGRTLAERMLAHGAAELLRANAAPDRIPNS